MSRADPIGLSHLPAILWLVWALFIVYGGTIPFHFEADRATVADKLSRLSLTPVVSPDTGRRVSILYVVQNWKKHLRGARGIDGCSSGPWFDGWSTGPLPIASREIFLTTSIGIAVVGDAVSEPGEVLREADQAMYRAKGAGGCRWELFDENLAPRMVERLDS